MAKKIKGRKVYRGAKKSTSVKKRPKIKQKTKTQIKYNKKLGKLRFLQTWAKKRYLRELDKPEKNTEKRRELFWRLRVLTKKINTLEYKKNPPIGITTRPGWITQSFGSPPRCGETAYYFLIDTRDLFIDIFLQIDDNKDEVMRRDFLKVDVQKDIDILQLKLNELVLIITSDDTLDFYYNLELKIGYIHINYGSN